MNDIDEILKKVVGLSASAKLKFDMGNEIRSVLRKYLKLYSEANLQGPDFLYDVTLTMAGNLYFLAQELAIPGRTVHACENMKEVFNEVYTEMHNFELSRPDGLHNKSTPKPTAPSSESIN